MHYKVCTDTKVLAHFLDPGTTAVLVIDMQNDFCCQEGGFAATGGKIEMILEMIPKLTSFLDGSRHMGVLIIYIKHSNTPETSSEAWLSREVLTARKQVTLCERGSWGSEIISELTPVVGDIVIEKHRYSGFFETQLGSVLRAKKTRSLIVTGVSTNVCVESTVRDAFMRDYFVFLPEDCVASTIRELHKPTLFNLSRYFGTVTSSKSILKALRNGPRMKEVF